MEWIILGAFFLGMGFGWAAHWWGNCERRCAARNQMRREFCDMADHERQWGTFATLCLQDCVCR